MGLSDTVQRPLCSSIIFPVSFLHLHSTTSYHIPTYPFPPFTSLRPTSSLLHPAFLTSSSSFLPPHFTNILTIQYTTGRSFDAMGPKTTVENAKAPADWVTLKGVKEPVKKDEEAPVSIAERRRRRRTGGN